MNFKEVKTTNTTMYIQDNEPNADIQGTEQEGDSRMESLKMAAGGLMAALGVGKKVIVMVINGEKAVENECDMMVLQ